MTRKNKFLVFLSLNVGLFFGGLMQLCAQRSQISFNSAWYFYQGTNAEAAAVDFDHSAWLPVQLPHTFNDKDVLADGRRGYYRGEAWYRREMQVPDDGRRRYLHFKGANQVSTLFVNGQEAGSHSGGYTAFTFDISDLLRPGTNVIAVRVTNAHDEDIPPLSADFTFFGGIYRGVQLVTTEDIHFDMLNHGSGGVFIDSPQINAEEASLRVRGKIINHSGQAGTVKVVSTFKIRGNEVLKVLTNSIQLTGEGEKEFEQTAEKVRGFELWSPDNPAVYTIHTALYKDEVLIDEVFNPFGFRWFHFDAQEGFFLNDEPLKLMGANRHQDRSGMGNALTDDMHRRDLELLKDMGANFLRTAHYPQSEAVLEAANRSGILVWEEIPLVNEVGMAPAFATNSKVMLREMIRQHYNHPSVVIWAYMNEIYWKHRFLPEEELPERNEITLQLARELEAICREEDPLRYTAMAMHNYPLYEKSGLTEVPQIVGWNLYHGWYYDDFDDFGKYMDAQHEKYPDRVLMVSEYGAGGDVRISSADAERFDFSNEGQIRFMSAFLEQITRRPYIAGSAVWNLVDFSSERRVDVISHLNSKGLLTADRKKKDAYYLTQSFMVNGPYVKLAHQWQNRLYSLADLSKDSLWIGELMAFSNAERCSLLVDGELYGVVATDRNIARWDLKLREGVHNLCVQAGGALDCTEKEFVLQPSVLSANVDLALNLGAPQVFRDHIADVDWLPAPQYRAGSYGYTGSENLYVGGKIGTKEDILTTDHMDPLYQTMLEGIESMRFDVPAGRYKVELYMVDYIPYARRFADVDEKVVKAPGIRIFHIDTNRKRIIHALDLGGDYGKNMPCRLGFEVQVANDEGLTIEFVPVKGQTLLSAIRVRSLQGLRH